MRHKWVNLVLLLLVAGELVTGAAGLMSGDSSNAFLLQAHSILGYGIVAVLVWKTALALRSLSRPARGRPRRVSLLLAAFLLLALGLGIVWSAGDFWSVAGITGMSLHIYAGVVLGVLIVWHSWSYTAGFRIGYDARKREALRLGGIVAVGAVAWVGAESLKDVAGYAGARRRFTGSHERRSYEGNRFPTTSWINDSPAVIDVDSWRLKVVGLSGTHREISLSELENGSFGLEYKELDATLDCTGGWYSNQVWGGVMLGDVVRALLADDDVAGGASCIVSSVTGYNRRYRLDDADGLLLATRVGGDSLWHGHGAPLRLVAPSRRGYDWVKWIDSVHVTYSPAWLQPWLPLQ